MKIGKNIALASTFSPRFLPLLAEAKRFCASIGSPLSIIHVGPKDEAAEKEFAMAFEKLALLPPSEIHWKEGDPYEAILQTIQENNIDLLIAGALEHPSEGRHFLGNISRSLMRHADCSLLFFIKPQLEAKAFRKLVAITDFSEPSRNCLHETLELAALEKSETVYSVRIFTIISQALAQSENDNAGTSENPLKIEEEKLRQFVIEAGTTLIPIEPKCVQGTTGFAASEYVEAIEADLLVIPSQLPDFLFPQGMDWIMDVIPSNLLVIRNGN